MSKEVVAKIKLEIVAGQASPAPPVGPALGQHGVNIMGFVREFNDRTGKMDEGTVVPVLITVFKDKSFNFVVKTPPASYLLKKAAGIAKGSGGELKYQLLLARDLGYLSDRDYPALRAEVDEISRMLSGLVKSLSVR